MSRYVHLTEKGKENKRQLSKATEVNERLIKSKQSLWWFEDQLELHGIDYSGMPKGSSRNIPMIQKVLEKEEEVKENEKELQEAKKEITSLINGLVLNPIERKMLCLIYVDCETQGMAFRRCNYSKAQGRRYYHKLLNKIEIAKEDTWGHLRTLGVV